MGTTTMALPGIQGTCQDVKAVDHGWSICPWKRKTDHGERRAKRVVPPSTFPPDSHRHLGLPLPFFLYPPPWP